MHCTRRRKHAKPRYPSQSKTPSMTLPLLALFLAAFAFGTAEFVIAGVLPDVALGLGISIPLAGYLVTGYAIGIALGGPLLTMLTSRFNRKALVIALGVGFVVGQALCAIAPTFEILLLTRILVSTLHGAYFGVAFILATSIVPPERRGFAMALVLAGLTVSNVLGVPGGTAVGAIFGWRATFWAVGVFGLVATFIIAFFLPADAGASAAKGDIRREVRALARNQVASGFVISILVMIGQYSLFTYIAPLLLEVTGVDPAFVPVILLVYGVGSTIGVFIGGRLADWRLMPSLITILSLQSLLFVALYLASPYPLLMAVVVIFWGGANFAFGSPLQTRMLIWAADAPNLTSALIPAGFNVGIAIGAILGSTLLGAGMGYQYLPFIGAVCLALAAVTAIISNVLEKRSSAVPPAPMALAAE